MNRREGPRAGGKRAIEAGPAARREVRFGEEAAAHDADDDDPPDYDSGHAQHPWWPLGRMDLPRQRVLFGDSAAEGELVGGEDRSTFVAQRGGLTVWRDEIGRDDERGDDRNGDCGEPEDERSW